MAAAEEDFRVQFLAFFPHKYLEYHDPSYAAPAIDLLRLLANG